MMRTHLLAAAACLVLTAPALAHWTGDYAQVAGPALHAWFDGLASGKGLCCSFADGVSIEDVDWDTTGDAQFPYRVRLDGKWIKVPAIAVVTVPNKYGRAVVWPYQEEAFGPDGATKATTKIRCFIPGAGS